MIANLKGKLNNKLKPVKASTTNQKKDTTNDSLGIEAEVEELVNDIMMMFPQDDITTNPSTKLVTTIEVVDDQREPPTSGELIHLVESDSELGNDNRVEDDHSLPSDESPPKSLVIEADPATSSDLTGLFY